MVLLTLVSIIQALALETLWSEIAEEGELAGGGFAGVMAALQGTVVLLSIVAVWLFFAHLVMRFAWVPGLRDTMGPFAIGLIEFVLAEFIAVGQLRGTTQGKIITMVGPRAWVRRPSGRASRARWTASFSGSPSEG